MTHGGVTMLQVGLTSPAKQTNVTLRRNKLECRRSASPHSPLFSAPKLQDNKTMHILIVGPCGASQDQSRSDEHVHHPLQPMRTTAISSMGSPVNLPPYTTEDGTRYLLYKGWSRGYICAHLQWRGTVTATAAVKGHLMDRADRRRRPT